MSTDYDGMKNMELYLLKNRADYYKKALGERQYYRKLSELEKDDTSTISQSVWNKNKAPKTSANGTKSDNTFYTNTEDSGTIGTNRANAASGNTTLGQSFTNDVVNRSAQNSQPETKPFVPTMTGPIPRYSQPETTGVNTDPYAIPWTEDQEKRKRLSDLQTQQNNLFMLQYGGYITDDIQPQLNEIQTEIDQISKELANTYTPGVEGGYIGDGSGGYDTVQNMAAPMNTPENGHSIGDGSESPFVNYAETLEPEPTLTERIQQDQLEKYQPWQLGSGQDAQTDEVSNNDKKFIDYINELCTNGGGILKDIMINAVADSDINPDVTDMEDFSEELNGVIRKCCEEYVPLSEYNDPNTTLQALMKNALIWKEGVFNHWNFVGDTLWSDQENTGYDSYIPDEIQGKAKDAQEDFFIVNGIRMNREQYGNYVKGATAQYAYPFLPAADIVNMLGLGMSVVDNIEDNLKGENYYNFSWENEIEDSYFTYLGARDMMNGVFKEGD